MAVTPGHCQAMSVCTCGIRLAGRRLLFAAAGREVKLSGHASFEKKGAPMRSRSCLGWTVALLSGMAALTPFSSPAFANLSNPVALNVPAPELMGSEWRNTPGNARLTLAGERGKVTILHFWTFG